MPVASRPRLPTTVAATATTSNPTTDSASYADLAEMSVTLTPIGSTVKAEFMGIFQHSGAAGVTITVAFQVGAEGEQKAAFESSPATNYFFQIVNNRMLAVTPGVSTTIKVRWLTSAAGALAVLTNRELIVTG